MQKYNSRITHIDISKQINCPCPISNGMKNQTSFKEKVYEAVKQIPAGKTMTYKEVASAAGRPKAWRIAGNILNTNYDPKIPCHRVICSNGKIGGYNRGIKQKKKLLREEGVDLQ